MMVCTAVLSLNGAVGWKVSVFVDTNEIALIAVVSFLIFIDCD